MQNPRLATRYAKSVLDLAVEKNALDVVLKDMQSLNSICTMSRDFVVMLRSPVINADKKLSVINLVMKSAALNPMTLGFMRLLVTKGREEYLPEIASAFIDQYKSLKNIKSVKLTTAAVIEDDIKKSILSKIAGYMPNDTIDLETAVNDSSLIGGFVLEVEDKLYDASIKKSLNDVKSGQQ